MLLIITWAIALPLMVQIDSGYHLRFIIALGEYNAHVLAIMCHSFQGISWTRISFHLTLAVVDVTVAHHIFYFLWRNLSAFHPATCMFCILQKGSSTVEPTIAVNLTSRLFSAFRFSYALKILGPAHANKNDSKRKNDEQQIWNKFGVQFSRIHCNDNSIVHS